ncbi:MAG: T9SS type A sorting domain-containing protein [Chitinophagales bacterium]|nr:T9SS type A sorting domain-containing protein [Chitinophagales bacterium]
MDNMSSGVTSYTSSTDNIYTYYTTTGTKDIVTSSSPGTYARWVYIDGTRSLPTIYYSPTDLNICTGETISFNCKTNNLNDSTGYDWCIQRISSPNSTSSPGACVFTSSVHTPGSYTFVNGQTVTETYQVKLRVRDECCGWSRPQYLLVTVYPNIANNTITAPATTTACGSLDPANIVGSTPTGGNGSYGYVWQISTDGGTNWSNVGVTTQSYDPANITTYGTYMYRRIVNSDACTSTSNTVTITIYPALDGNSVEPTTYVYCAANGASVDFSVVNGSTPSGGNGTYTYLWETNANGAGWVNGAGTNNAINYDPPSQTIVSPGTYYFRRTVSSAVCGSSLVSNVDSIKVYPAPVNPTSAAVDTINFCDGDPGLITLTLSGGSGTQSYWYTGSCGGTLIGYGTGANGLFQLPSPTTTTTYYGRWADLCGNLSASCASVNVPVVNCVCGDTGMVTYLGNNKSLPLVELCTESGWTYFYNTTEGKKIVYFAINKTPGGAGYNTNAVTLTATMATSTNPSTTGWDASVIVPGNAVQTDGNFSSGRYWNAVVTSGTLNGKVKVRFYFPGTDLTRVTNAANAFAANVISAGFAIANVSDYIWYKTNDGSAYAPASDVEADRINGGNFTLLTPAVSTSSSGTENGINYVEFDVSSFSGGSVSKRVSPEDPVLPIELLSFLGWNDGPINRLEWVTASEFNNDYFIVERSVNARDFDAIGTVDAVGNSQVNTKYPFVDSTPNFGINYYRLKQVDNDGKYTYSKIIAIERNSGSTFNSGIVGYRPNPTVDKFFVDLQINKPSKFNVRITNALGQVVEEKTVTYDKGFHTFTLNSNEYASGAYIVEFNETTTGEKYEVKFVKQ